MRLTDNINVAIGVEGGEAGFTLRRPKNEELNTFLIKRWAGKEDSHILTVRREFFDGLFISTDVEGPSGTSITAENMHIIPDYWKAQAIIRVFETVSVNVKN